ncbi:scavenger receptor cysteine-rich domain-containing protein DMBT1-like isoform X2 [Glandiceps talaboti]
MVYKELTTSFQILVLILILQVHHGTTTQTGSQSAIRLVDGPSRDRGRVEVLIHGKWGTVCDDGFDDTAALVVCKHLGYNNGTAESNAKYGMGTGQIWLDNVHCNGDESSILSCDYDEIGVNNCAHYEDVGVTCSELIKDGDVRLSSVSGNGMGRVEVFHRGKWGTVCDDFFDDIDAKVVCQQLGFRSGVVNGTTSPGNGSILLDDIQCTGKESRLTQCRHRGWLEHNCNHSEDVVVTCGQDATSCSELRQAGYESSGDYVIDPDGPNNGVEPFRVYCNMTDSDGFTVLQHDKESRGHVNGFEAGLSFSVDVVYDNNISLAQVAALIERSTECGQYLKYECHGSLINSGATKYAAWSDRNGNQMANWAGAPVGQHICSCGATGTCSNGKTTCNCDNNDNVWRYDDGVIIDKEFLPVTKLEFGDNGDSGEEGYYTLGALECKEILGGSIRLVNGDTDHSGRLEIYHNTWGTVCNDHFTSTEAMVVCRQLGFLGGAVTPTNLYGQGSDPILLDDVNCVGGENTLRECSSRGWGVHKCGHGQDVGITCDVPAFADVRLVNGDKFYEGRLEVYFNGEWGTVCADEFDEKDATVVCRQLGYSGGEIQMQGSHGQGFGPIVLDDVDCTGHENSLQKCGNSGFGEHNCGHDEDVSIHCKVPDHGEVRLTGGVFAYEGRLEIFHSKTEEWQTVCADTIDDKAAQVVCRQLGYRGGEIGIDGTIFGQSTKSILLKDVTCTGQENNILECPHNAGGQGCLRQDAIITCDIPEKGDVRLVDGMDAHEGRLEVYFDSQWMRICNVDEATITVACKQLGFSDASINKEMVLSVAHIPTAPFKVLCTGQERSLMDCNYTEDGTSHNYVGTEDIYVMCSVPSYTPDEGHIRLTGGNWSNEGRLEIYHNGKWGSVCDDNFNSKSVEVVCQQLGYLPGIFLNLAAFGEGDGHIWLDDVSCSGLETSLSDCYHGNWGSHDCTHSEDVSVLCKRPDHIYLFSDMHDIRLVAGNNSAEGRVEIFHNDEWGTICDDSFDEKDAQVVCRQLGYSGGAVHDQAYFGEGTNDIWLDEVNCQGQEQRLSNCNHDGWGLSNCEHNEDVGVTCF